MESQVRRLSVVVVFASLALLAGTVAAVFSPGLRHILGLARHPRAYQIGERVDIPREAFETTSYTLVIFTRASCAACQAVQPRLKELAKEISATRDVRVSVVMPAQSPDEGRKYVQGLGLTDSSFFPLTLRSLRLRVVPTAMLVDRDGTILGVSEGAGESFRAFTDFVLSRLGTT